MKKYLRLIRNFLSDKKNLAVVLISIIIGVGLTTAYILNSISKKEESSFRTIESFPDNSDEGEVAGETTTAPTASPSATVKPIFRKYVSPTATPTRAPTRTTSKSNSGSTGGTSTSTGTTTSSSSSSNPTSTATPTPKSTSTPVPATFTPTSAPATATSAPTATPTQSQPTPTPTPAFSASISTSVEGDTLKVNVSANKTIQVCIFHYLDKDGVPAGSQNGSPSGNSCSNERSVSGVEKVKVYLASNPEGLTTEVEKSAPF